MIYLYPQTGQQVRKCMNWAGDRPTNSPTPRRDLHIIEQRRVDSYADATKDAIWTTPAVLSSLSIAQSVDLASN
nr:unnamed protein product [Callosobruchus analis]